MPCKSTPIESFCSSLRCESNSFCLNLSVMNLLLDPPLAFLMPFSHRPKICSYLWLCRYEYERMVVCLCPVTDWWSVVPTGIRSWRKWKNGSCKGLFVKIFKIKYKLKLKKLCKCDFMCRDDNMWGTLSGLSGCVSNGWSGFDLWSGTETCSEKFNWRSSFIDLFLTTCTN